MIFIYLEGYENSQSVRTFLKEYEIVSNVMFLDKQK